MLYFLLVEQIQFIEL